MVRQFLRLCSYGITRNPLTCLQIAIDLPDIPEVGKSHSRDLVRAIPPVRQSSRRSEQSGRLNFALVRVPSSKHNPFTQGLPLIEW